MLNNLQKQKEIKKRKAENRQKKLEKRKLKNNKHQGIDSI